VSAGLDYASVGPEHAWLHDLGRAEYAWVSDAQALDAFQLVAQLEGLIPALESAHALAHAGEVGAKLSRDDVLLINLSGRGDKDVEIAESYGLDGGRGVSGSKEEKG